MQKSGGFLVGKEAIRKDLIEIIKSMEKKDSKHVVQLIKDSVFSDPKNPRTCTLTNFMDSTLVRYKTVEVWKDKSGADFNKLLKNFINTLSEEIEGYFPDGGCIH